MTKLSRAVDVLVDELIDDDQYYYGWQANIAVQMQDAYMQRETDDMHVISNDAATRFLDMLTYSRRDDRRIKAEKTGEREGYVSGMHLERGYK